MWAHRREPNYSGWPWKEEAEREPTPPPRPTLTRATPERGGQTGCPPPRPRLCQVAWILWQADSVWNQNAWKSHSHCLETGKAPSKWEPSHWREPSGIKQVSGRSCWFPTAERHRLLLRMQSLVILSLTNSQAPLEVLGIGSILSGAVGHWRHQGCVTQGQVQIPQIWWQGRRWTPSSAEGMGLSSALFSTSRVKLGNKGEKIPASQGLLWASSVMVFLNP